MKSACALVSAVIVLFVSLLQAVEVRANANADVWRNVIAKAARQVVLVRTGSDTADVPTEADARRAGIPLERLKLLRAIARNQDTRHEASGFLFGARRYVVTTYALFEDATRATVRYSDGTEQQARLIGADEPSGLAVLEVDSRLAPLAPGSVPPVGTPVLALGMHASNALQVSAGIISAVGGWPGAHYALASDAGVSRYHAGGPLLDLRGRVVGALYANETLDNEHWRGAAVAVDVDELAFVTRALQSYGTVVRGALGIWVDDVSPELASAIKLDSLRGAHVYKRDAHGPSATAGPRNNLMDDDVILGIDGVPVANAAHAARLISHRRPGATIELSLWRFGKRVTVRIKLDKR